MIGSIGRAREFGAAGDDAAVTALLLAAQDRVERYCQDRFEPDSSTRVLRVVEGLAVSPVRLRSVTSVATVGTTPTTIPSSAYRLLPRTGALSASLDYVGIEVATSGGDGLVAGAEPWNGGWAGLWARHSPEFIEVAGQWGWAATPDDVSLAVDLLAAAIGPTDYVPSTDAEGNPAGLPGTGYDRAQATDPAPERVAAAGRVERTTGVAEVDRMLQPYRRQPINLG